MNLNFERRYRLEADFRTLTASDTATFGPLLTGGGHGLDQR